MINERAVFYIKHLVAENGFLRWRARNVSSTSARGWCTGLKKDGVGREVGGGFRMGNTCKSMADSCQYVAKTTTIL